MKLTPQVDALVRERVGLDIRHLERSEQSRRICVAMERAGFRDDASYANFLRASPQGLMDLASEMSVGETYFFRDPEQLHELTHTVLPRLLVERPRDHALQIWSAGCASGEEAYTIAMLLDERGLLSRAQIVGTDLAEASLERARRGLYGAWSLRAINKLAARRYFTRVADKFQISSELMRHVRFERQSLTDEHAPMPAGVSHGFDLILCKNVLIYLTEAACMQVSKRLAHSLLPRGTLLTGASDNFKDLPDLWTRQTTASGVMFQRHATARTSMVGGFKLASVRPALFELPKALNREEAEPPLETHVLLPGRAKERTQPNRSTDQSTRQPTIEELESALEKEPQSEELHVQLATLFLAEGRDVEAEAQLRTALYLDRKLVMAHFLLALLHQRKGDHERALRAYLRVAALCSELPEDEPVKLGDGVSHKLLRESAQQNAQLLERGAKQP